MAFLFGSQKVELCLAGTTKLFIRSIWYSKIVWKIKLAMNLTAEQIHLASLIDAHVRGYPATDRGDEPLFVTLTDYMDALKRILDSATPVPMDYLC